MVFLLTAKSVQLHGLLESLYKGRAGSIQEHFYCFLAWLVSIPTFWAPFLFFVIWKHFVIFLSRLSTDTIYPFMGMDTYFSWEEFYRHPRANMGRILVIDGRVSLAEFREHFRTKILEAVNPKTGKLVYDGFYKVPLRFMGYLFYKFQSSVKIEEHIKEGPDVGDGKELLQNFLVKWREEPFAENGPLWEILFFEVKGNTWIAWKINHILADGYTLLNVMEKITGTPTPYIVQDHQESLGEKVNLCWRGPLLLSRMLLTRTNLLTNRQNPFKSSRATAGALTQWLTLDLGPILEIRRRTRTHFSTVVGTLTASALRKYMLETRTLEELPEYLHTANSLPWPNHPEEMVNHMNFGYYKQRFARGSVLERLLDFEKDFQQVASSGTDKIYKKMYLNFINYVPIELLKRLIPSNPGSNLFSCMMANKDLPYKILGHPVKHTFPLAGLPEPDAACFMVTITQNERMDCCLVLNRNVFPDASAAKRFEEYFREEVALLHGMCNQFLN